MNAACRLAKAQLVLHKVERVCVYMCKLHNQDDGSNDLGSKAMQIFSPVNLMGSCCPGQCVSLYENDQSATMLPLGLLRLAVKWASVPAAGMCTGWLGVNLSWTAL